MIIWKITDSDCPVCAEMSKFDGELILSMGFELTLLPFDSAVHHQAISAYIRENLVEPDGTVDIPMYIVESDGEFIGAVVGRQTKSELKRKLLQTAG